MSGTSAAAVGTEVVVVVPQLRLAEPRQQQARRLVGLVPLRQQVRRLVERAQRRHRLQEERRRLAERRRRLAPAGPGAQVVVAAAVAAVMRPATPTRMGPLTLHSSRSLAMPTACRR